MQIPADLRLAVPLMGIGALWLVSAWGVAFIANHRGANWWSWFALGLLGGPYRGWVCCEQAKYAIIVEVKLI